MQDTESHDVVKLENQITERYGLLISQTQLAELLGRCQFTFLKPAEMFRIFQRKSYWHTLMQPR